MSDAFRDHLSNHLSVPRKVVDLCIDTLMDAERIPARDISSIAALAADGATILLAIGSQQERTDSVRRVSHRLSAMNFFARAGAVASEGPADLMRKLPTQTFGLAIESLLKNLWASLRGSSAAGFRPTSISMSWCDERGELLFGTIEQKSTGRKMVFSNAAIPAPLDLGGWDFLVQLPPSIGGTELSPLALLNVGNILKDGVACTHPRIAAR